MKKIEMLTWEKVEELKENYFNEMNKISVDFIKENQIEDMRYIEDNINSFCDDLIDFYYEDLKEWLIKNNNIDYIDLAIEEFGKNESFYKDIQSAQYLKYHEELYEDIENICICLVLNFISENYVEISEQFLNDFIFDLQYDYYDFINQNISNFKEDFENSYNEYMEELKQNLE